MRDHRGAPRVLPSGWAGWFCVIGVILLLALLLNLSTPLLVDDHFFAFIVGTDERVTTLADVFRSQIEFYKVWSGRSVTHFLAQSLLLLGDPLARVVNAIGFTLLIVLVYFHARGLRSPRPSVLVAIGLALWFATPDFGQTVLWLTGAANYLWGAVVLLAALLPFRLYLDGERPEGSSPAAFIGTGFMGLLAGWSNENTGPAAILVMTAYVYLIYRKGRPIPVWSAAAIAGAIAGVLLLLMAPGNIARLESLSTHSGLLLDPSGLFPSLLTVTHVVFVNNLFTLMLVLAVLLVFASRYVDECASDSVSLAGVYAGASLLATYAMVLSPHLPGRAWFGITVLAVTAIAVVYSSLDFSDELVRRLAATALTGMTALFLTQFVYAYIADIRPTFVALEARSAFIYEERRSGENHVIVEPVVPPLTKHNGAYGIQDLSEKADDWPNYDVARYYDIESIVLVPGVRRE